MSCVDNIGHLATYGLVYYLRELACDLKLFSWTFFATKGAIAYQIMPIFQESVAILEFTCKTPIFTAVSDGAFPNEKVYRID